MALRHKQQTCAHSEQDEHEWQPLFAAPVDTRQEGLYMARGYADYLRCAHCGIVSLRDGSADNMLTLSHSFTEAKLREASDWNTDQQATASRPAKASA